MNGNFHKIRLKNAILLSIKNKSKMSRKLPTKGDPDKDLNPPSEMPVGFGSDSVDLKAQQQFWQMSGLPDQTNLKQILLHTQHLVDELSAEIDWYYKTMFNDLKNASQLCPDPDAVHLSPNCGVSPFITNLGWGSKC